MPPQHNSTRSPSGSVQLPQPHTPHNARPSHHHPLAKRAQTIPTYSPTIKPTGPNPKSLSRSSPLLLLSPSSTPHIHPTTLTSVRPILNSCSTPLLPPLAGPTATHQTLPTQAAHTLPFSHNENPFPVRTGRHPRNFLQAGITLSVFFLFFLVPSCFIIIPDC